MPAAPPRFSITTDCFHFSASFAATVRAEMSVPPPGGKGTIHVTGFAGYVCAAARTVQKNRHSPHLFRIALLQYAARALRDGGALLRFERTELRCPSFPVHVIGQPRR